MAPTDLPPVTLVLQEVQAITSSMRRNQRWASASSASHASHPTLPPSLHAARAGRKAALSGGKEKGPGDKVDEGDLMIGFIQLRRALSGLKGRSLLLSAAPQITRLTPDITTLPPLSIIEPFLALIRSPLTSGPITSLALAAFHSIAVSVLPLYFTTPPTTVAPSTPLEIALAHATLTLSSCRFPSSSPQQDELVLLRLLRAIEALAVPLPFPISSPSVHYSLLDHMADESVCELLEVGLGMLARARLTDGLRNTAQTCVQSITRACFTRLKNLTPEDVDRLISASKAVEEENKVKEKEREDKIKAQEAAQAENPEESKLESEAAKDAVSATMVGEKGLDAEPEIIPSFTPYGLPTILELLRVLIALLDPTDQTHTDSMRSSALAILNTALEVGGSSLAQWPELRERVQDQGCRYLFQLTRSDNPTLLAHSLRTTSTLFATLRPQLKLQLELFLSYLIDRLAPTTPPQIPNLNPPQHSSRPGSPVVGEQAEGDRPRTPAIDGSSPATATPRPLAGLPPVPSETKELMLDTLTQIATNPSFFVDCWVNFDSTAESEDMFERLIGFLTRGVYPNGPPKQDGSSRLFEGLDNTQLLSLEILLEFVNAMAERSEDGAEDWLDSYPTVESLQQSKDRKAVFLQGAAMFNVKPKTGLAFLEKNGIIAADPSDSGTDEEKRIKATARFLRQSSRLDKKLLGEYISRPDQVELLKAFIGLFDFGGKSIADAMRELLETFRLPGEAQPIARITETFAEHFFSFAPREFQTSSQCAITDLSRDCEPGCGLRPRLLRYHAQHGLAQPSKQETHDHRRLPPQPPRCQRRQGL